jgi:hypothetical protein
MNAIIISMYVKETSVKAATFQIGFLLGLFFDPADGGDMFLRKVG